MNIVAIYVLLALRDIYIIMLEILWKFDTYHRGETNKA